MTLIPFKNEVARSDLNNPSTPCFAVQYCGWPGRGVIEAMDPRRRRWRSATFGPGSREGSAFSDLGFSRHRGVSVLLLDLKGINRCVSRVPGIGGVGANEVYETG